MNKGYVILAVNAKEYRQAAALAYSIKTKNQNANVSLIVSKLDDVSDHWLEPFESVVELPFVSSEVRRTNDWQLYWATPYDYTIAIDCKSLVKENHDQLWDYLTENYEICFPYNAINFDGVDLNNTDRSVYKTEYHLDILHSNMFYFKKDSDAALRYFKMADPYMRNWKTAFAKHFAPQHVTLEYDQDIMHMLVAACVGQDVSPVHRNVFKYIDMEISRDDGVIGRWNRWTDRLNTWASRDGKIKIQNFAINHTLYYGEDEFLTTEIFEEQKNHYRTVTKKINEL